MVPTPRNERYAMNVMSPATFITLSLASLFVSVSHLSVIEGVERGGCRGRGGGW